jgi:hypothetical protein
VQPRHVVSVPTRIPPYIYNSYLIESTLKFKDRNWVWGRAENVDRDSLILFQESPLTLLVDEQRYARVQAYTAGYERELPRRYSWFSVGLDWLAYRISRPQFSHPFSTPIPCGFSFSFGLARGNLMYHYLHGICRGKGHSAGDYRLCLPMVLPVRFF